MTETFKVRENCTGFSMPDGTKYDAKDGRVQVADHHAAAVRRSSPAQIGLLNTGSRVTFTRVPGKDCPGCGADIFTWQLC
ncbi:MAG TPA: hypothetical protein VMV41_09800, partial [Cellulomonadaceae bacterium]|nr:hypothetical protein [Cellulomonadaceae bacterium]